MHTSQLQELGGDIDIYHKTVISSSRGENRGESVTGEEIKLGGHHSNLNANNSPFLRLTPGPVLGSLLDQLLLNIMLAEPSPHL